MTLHALLQAKSGAVESVVLFEPVFGRALHLTDDAAIGPLEAHFEDYCRRALAGEEGAVGRMVDYWFGAGAYVRLPDPVRGYLNANARRNALDVLSGFKDETATDQLAALGTPIRVVYGDRSPDIVQAIGRSLLKLLPDARMEALAGANHGMLDSHPEAVARLIAA